MRRDTKLMLQLCLTFSFMLFVQMALSQDVVPPKGVKYHSFKASKSAKFFAIYKGKKAGIYNAQTHEFDVKMDKQIIVHSPIFDFFTVIGEDGFQTYSAFYTDTLIEMPKDELYFRYWSDQFHIEDLKDGRYLFNDVETPNLNPDPRNHNKDIWDPDHSFQGSGLFNFNTGLWEIPREYYRLYNMDDIIVCLKRDSTTFKKTGHFKDEYLFDIYKKDGDYKLLKKDVDTLSTFLNPKFFGCDSLYEIEDFYFVGIKKGMKGLIHLDPFSWNIRMKKESFFDQALPYEFDFIWKNPMADGFFCIKGTNRHELMYFNQEIDSLGNYSVHRPKRGDYLGWGSVFLDSIPSNYTPLYSTHDELNFSEAQILNDSLVKLRDSYDGNWQTIESITDPGSDSVDWEGQYVYNVTGDYDSVWIYNYVTDQYMLSEAFRDIHFAGDHYIVLERDGRISYLDLELNLIKGPYEYDDFYEDVSLVSGLFESGKYRSVNYLGSERSSREEKYHAFRCTRHDGKMDLFKIENKTLTPIAIELGTDLAWYDQSTNTGVYLKEDKVTYDMVDTTFVFPIEQGVKLMFDGENSPNMYILIYENDSGQTYYDRYVEGYLYNTSKVSLQIGIYQIGNSIVASFATNRTIEMYDDFWFENWGNRNINLEYSGIWEKTDSGLILKTPYYSMIEPTPSSFIVQTGSFVGEIQYDESGEPIMDPKTGWLLLENDQESKTLLLDQNYKAIQMLDYYDFEQIKDLGFGLEITTSKGKFFATYDGEAITDDSWDKFELTKNGKLMAIREEKDIEDFQTGEFLHVDGVVKMYDLPKK